MEDPCLVFDSFLPPLNSDPRLTSPRCHLRFGPNATQHFLSCVRSRTRGGGSRRDSTRPPRLVVARFGPGVLDPVHRPLLPPAPMLTVVGKKIGFVAETLNFWDGSLCGGAFCSRLFPVPHLRDRLYNWVGGRMRQATHHTIPSPLHRTLSVSRCPPGPWSSPYLFLKDRLLLLGPDGYTKSDNSH